MEISWGYKHHKHHNSCTIVPPPSSDLANKNGHELSLKFSSPPYAPPPPPPYQSIVKTFQYPIHQICRQDQLKVSSVYQYHPLVCLPNNDTTPVPHAAMSDTAFVPTGMQVSMKRPWGILAVWCQFSASGPSGVCQDQHSGKT